MGLFNANYNKPGPGVSKDEPEKNGFLRFWGIYFRKFSNFIKLNLMFAVPFAVCCLLIYCVQLVSGNSIFSILSSYIWVLLFPFLAGLTYVCRNYAREEHAFLFSDFVDAVKHNWKAFLINGVISMTLYLLLSVAISYYQAYASQNGFFYVPLVLSVILACVLVWAEFYIPVMIVTFDLKLRQIYKNALIFSVLGLWRNLLITAVGVAFWLVGEIAFYEWPLIYMMVLLVLALLFLFSFSGFLINFLVYPVIEKYMIVPQQPKKEVMVPEEEESDFKDSLY